MAMLRRLPSLRRTFFFHVTIFLAPVRLKSRLAMPAVPLIHLALCLYSCVDYNSLETYLLVDLCE